MDSTLLASVIAVCGVIISALISFGIADRTAKLQITKVRYDIQHSKAEKLTEKRLETYPALYSLLNRLNLLIQDKRLEVKELELIYMAIYEWYLQNGILMGSKSNGELWAFIRNFRKLCRGGNDAIAGSLGTRGQRGKFTGYLDAIEIELKNEIGIFEVEYFDPNARFSSYHEVTHFYREKNPDESHSHKP